MFHEELLVTTVFKVLNVFVFIAATVYLARKHIGIVRALIAKQHGAKKELKSEGVVLDRVINTMHDEADAQQQWISRIGKNIERWNNYVKASYEREQQECAVRQQGVQEKVQLQQQALMRLNVERSVMPAAWHKAQHELAQKMHGEQGKRYIQSLLSVLKKGAA